MAAHGAVAESRAKVEALAKLADEAEARLKALGEPPPPEREALAADIRRELSTLRTKLAEARIELAEAKAKLAGMTLRD